MSRLFIIITCNVYFVIFVYFKEILRNFVVLNCT